jgi:hypothetical protein
MIAAEQDPAVGQSEAQVVRGVTRSVDRLETPTIAGDPVPVLQGYIGHEVPIATLLDGGIAPLAPTGQARGLKAHGVGAEPVGRGAGRRLQRLRRRRVVTMGVRDQDVGHPLARETGEERLDMLGKIRTGVDHRDLANTDDVGSGSPEGEGARIARNDPADHRCDWLEPAVFERKLAAEGDLDSHDRETTRNSVVCLMRGLDPRIHESFCLRLLLSGSSPVIE